MAWISFSALPCRKKKRWQLTSQCYWKRMCPWHSSELVCFLVGLRTYQHPGTFPRLSTTRYKGRVPIQLLNCPTIMSVRLMQLLFVGYTITEVCSAAVCSLQCSSLQSEVCSAAFCNLQSAVQQSVVCSLHSAVQQSAVWSLQCSSLQSEVCSAAFCSLQSAVQQSAVCSLQCSSLHSAVQQSAVCSAAVCSLQCSSLQSAVQQSPQLGVLTFYC